MLMYVNGTYVEADAPEAVESPYAGMAYEDIAVELIRRRYTINDELAIQRQREEKPEEFAQYFAYCEACKQKARGYIGETKEADEGESGWSGQS